MLGSDKLNIQAQLSCIAVRKVGMKYRVSKLLWRKANGMKKGIQSVTKKARKDRKRNRKI